MSAVFSACKTWRYRLERDIDPLLGGPVAALIGINPSYAGAERNDQTISKDIGFGKRLGWRRIIKGNVYGFVATDIRDLAKAADPIGPENDEHLEEIISDADLVIPVWGTLDKLPPALRNRWRRIVALASIYEKPLHCFGTTNDGQPRHTARIGYDTSLVRWTPPT